MKKPYTLTIFTDNSPGVLHRLTVLFTRRRLNIDSVSVSETEQHSVSRFTIVVPLEERLVPVIVRQIRRIIEVQQAYASEDEDLLFKEIAFYKVRADSSEHGEQVEQLAKKHSASVAMTEEGYIVIEKSGSEEEINSLYTLLEQFGIQEFVRSGRIAIRRNPLHSEIGIRLQNFEAEEQQQPVLDAL